jgi:UDP-N-acetylmuramyl pentapeptide phosphotransferase/UDP-N-acetylglucosamine-1-phosphate transferase
MGLAIFLAFLVYVVLTLLTAWFFARKQKKLKGKIFVFISCIFIAILIPTWDIPIIKWKFNQLCKNEAGIHAYEQVVLPPKYWNKDGTLKFPQ